jgi:hypothetical protein
LLSCKNVIYISGKGLFLPKFLGILAGIIRNTIAWLVNFEFVVEKNEALELAHSCFQHEGPYLAP